MGESNIERNRLKHSFWAKWSSNRHILFNVCFNFMKGDFFNAEDALSTAMLKALNGFLISGDEPRNFTGWAISVTKNVCIDMLRKQKRERLQNEDFELQLHDTADHSGDERSTDLLMDLICELIETLPPKINQAARLRMVMNLSYLEISKKLKITEQTARKRVQTARILLRKKSKLREMVN